MKAWLLGFLLAAVPASAFADAWEIDPSHSQADFSVRHMMISNVRGEFGKVKGMVNYDDKDPSKSTIEATIDAASINTREPKRDEHLKSPEFFDVKKYPTITFKSKSVKKKGQKFAVMGDLTIHGVTKPVTLDAEISAPVKDPWGNTRRGATATTKINRKDFGLTWNKALETGGVVVGDEVAIEIEVEAVKKAAAEPKKAEAPSSPAAEPKKAAKATGGTTK